MDKAEKLKKIKEHIGIMTMAFEPALCGVLNDIVDVLLEETSTIQKNNQDQI